MTEKLFDIIIPIGPNDINVINSQLEYTKKNIIGYRNIYLISYDPSLNIDGCITINENIFPFSIDTVAEFHGKRNRNGWYLQQLLKLYAGLVIPDILDRYLVIDSDTYFLKPITFVDNGKCLYNYGSEFHHPYFEHMKKLDESFVKVYPDKSGICHHMMFETKYVRKMFDIVEKKHNDTFFNVFLRNVANGQEDKSGASEYEIYFNYIVKQHEKDIIIRPLVWKNTNRITLDEKYDYISYHWYMR